MNRDMSQSSVTLASILQVKGEPLSEEEMWSLLFLATEQILEDLNKGSSNYVVCPWSTLLHATGSLSFQDNVSFIEATPFKAPEILQGQGQNLQLEISKVHVYSLGMTLYWSAEFRVPPNQPLQLSKPLLSILLMMCEDLPQKRASLPLIWEACFLYQQEAAVSLTQLHIKRLVSLVLGSITEMEQIVVEESKFVQQNRSYMIRRRLHQKQSELSLLSTLKTLDPERDTQRLCASAPNSKFFLSGSTNSIVHGVPLGIQQDDRFNLGSAFSEAPKRSSSVVSFQRCLLQKKERFSRPEFIQLAGEAPVTLLLPGSIVTKKGKSSLSQRELYVVLLNGQCLEVKCDIKSKARDVFNLVRNYANLVEYFYFGLACQKGKEFFFLNDETKLYEVAPEGWNDRSKKKTTIVNFTLFLRIKFFVSHFHLIQHSLTRHQFYLQLRKDILEERIYCNDEMLLRLGALALQVEFGNYSPEAQGKHYFLVEDYIPASMIERMTPSCVQLEISKMHRCHGPLSGEEVELEFLKLTQKLPEYGVFFYEVFQEKKVPEAEMNLGICAKGIIVYEVKNNNRIASLRFQWQEIGKISTQRKKFTIESSSSGKKHTFITDSAKTCKYLLDLCSDQHRFNAQMSSGHFSQVLSEDNQLMQMFKSDAANVPQRECLPLIQRLSCSENRLLGSNLENTSGRLLGKPCDNSNVENGHRVGNEVNQDSAFFGWSHSETCSYITENQRMCLPAQLAQNIVTGSQNPQRENYLTGLEREIICVTLKRDPEHGFGFVIIGSENVGKLDLGIFIASIIPGGPAERAKKIKPGGRIISLNSISLEGATFNMAVKMIQNFPDKVDLIVSQPKDVCEAAPTEGMNRQRKHDPARSEVSPAASGRNSLQRSCSSNSKEPTINSDELEATLSWSLVPNLGQPQIPTPSAGGLHSEDPDSAHPSPPAKINTRETYWVELVKENGTFGISVTGGINTSVRYGGIYVKSIVPGGPAAKEGQIEIGDRLLEVDGVNLCGITHKQAVECLKNSQQVARLVLERRDQRPAEQCPSADDRKKDECVAVSLATTLPDNPESCALVTDDNAFEVTLKKNSSGLGFSFLQTARESSDHLRSYVVRIKRLFPGQPAEENGEIAVGDIILAVNGKPTQGLSYQEVLHLLRGAPEKVTLRLCRPLKGILPEIDQDLLTPTTSPDKEFTRAECLTPEHRSNLNPGNSEDSSSLESEEDVSSKTVSFHKTIDKEEWGSEEGEERPWVTLLSHPDVSHDCSWSHHQETAVPELVSPLEDLRQNCYSVCDIKTPESPEFERNDHDECHKYSLPAFTSNPVDEEYLTISTTSATPLSYGRWLEAPSRTTLQLPSCTSKPHLVSLPIEESGNSEDEWEDLEETIDAESDLSKENGENGISCDNTKVLLLPDASSELNMVDKPMEDLSTFLRPEDVPEIVLVKDSDAQLGLKLTERTEGDVQGIYVLEIVPGSPASKEGSLQPNDQILSICGVWMEGINLDEALQVCEAADHTVHIQAMRVGYPVIPRGQYIAEDLRKQDYALTPSKAYSPPTEDYLIEVDLEKRGTGSLGFALTGGRNGHSFQIKAISPGSIADLDGRLQAGDILLKVNGKSILGQPHRVVIDLIRQTQGTVRLTVRRSTDVNSSHSSHGYNTMFSRRKDATLPGKSLAGGATVTRGLKARRALPSPSQDKTASPMGNQVFETKVNSQKVELCLQSFSLRNDYADLLEDSTARAGSNIWKSRASYSSENWNNEDGQHAGSSRDSTVETSGLTIISEEELTEVSEIRSIPNSFHLMATLRSLIETIEKQIARNETFVEFLSLDNVKPLDDCILGNAPQNKEKNRYRDIVPYDGTRVPLGERKDYINASYIRILNSEEEYFYIATQGPLPGTTEDFWQMVWENKSNVIAMMTKEIEDGFIKCHRYWPISLNKPLELQNYIIALENYQILETFTIRAFKMVKKTGSVHFVHQIQFINWPDHGIPTSFDAFVKYVRYMKKIHETGPIIAHCSAGIGRTGVLLCVDVVLRALEKDFNFNIKNIVTQMREQRFGMVQTKEQYHFCYEIVLYVLRKILTSALSSIE
ncbi:FERM and PDZ domain-containing protein 2 isoform X3 [Notamacropus eugenii]|uniref:FERM and PDZ domain-containing protein 2 isoform X3 n=1 Tax=Notamacropus eugenii TaxID=9315 RepID=UPI003B67E43A